MSVMSNNKDVSSTSLISFAGGKSLLPEDVQQALQDGMKEGFDKDYLDISSNIIDDNMIPEICEWMAKLGDRVKSLDLSWSEITSKGAKMLFDSLRVNESHIKKVDLRNNKRIDNSCMESLGEYIKYNKYIEEINIRDNKILDAGLEILAMYVEGNTTFKRLDVNDNRGITDKSIPVLAKMIESSHITEIGFTDTSITQRDIFTALFAQNVIKSGSSKLELSSKSLGDSALFSICECMKKYDISKLKEINLYGNRITSKGGSELFNTLRECSSAATKLDISMNEIDDECMNNLGEYLQDNDYLEALLLGSNKISNKGVEMLSEHLNGNISLRELNLSHNKGITDLSGPYLMDIAKKTSITEVSFWFTSISTTKRFEIDDKFKLSIDKREIPIKSNCKSAAKIFYASASR